MRQPSISGFLSGRVDLSDDQLERLLSCMGFRLEVVRRPVVPEFTRSERRSWQLHRRVSSLLNRDNIQEWRPTIERNVDRLGDQATGQPHERNVQRWRDLVDRGDLPGLHRVLPVSTATPSRCARSPPWAACSRRNSVPKRWPSQADATPEQLEHAIRTACQIIQHAEVIVVGSQAILGTYDESHLPAAATMSIEVDILPIAD